MALDNDGDTAQVQGSGSKPYQLKNVGGVLSCSCPAWRNQSAGIDRRTCKHLKKLRGEAVELARIGGVKAPAILAKAPPIQFQDELIQAEPGFLDILNALELHESIHRSEHDAAIRESAAGSVAATKHAAGTKLRQDEKAKLFGPPVLLAHSFWDEPHDFEPAGWWQSEKLDGVRAYWDGKNFISRQGNVYHAPAWFKEGLPDHPLDGELWMGRQMFQETISVVKSMDSGDRWKKVTYVVFDHPAHSGKFEDRLTYLRNLRCHSPNPYWTVLEHRRISGRAELIKILEELVALGAEGAMIRQPESLYVANRSTTLLKVKKFKDDEGVVIGHVPGKGRHKGVLGSVDVRLKSGVEFNVGTGFSDAERRNPPAIGSTVTFRYTELTKDGKPKCASFVAIRDYE